MERHENKERKLEFAAKGRGSRRQSKQEARIKRRHTQVQCPIFPCIGCQVSPAISGLCVGRLVII